MERASCPRSGPPVLTLNALGEDAPDTPLLSYLLQRTLRAREEERKREDEAEEHAIVVQEYEELYSLTLYFLDTSSAEWT